MTTSISTIQNPTAEQVVQHLVSIGINFLALDFDQTILRVHTGGVWDGSLAELVPHVRPQLRNLIQAVVAHNKSTTEVPDDPSKNNHFIHLAVVTFSGQISLVRGVLESIVGDGELADSIPIRGSNGSWKEPYPNRDWWPEDADLNFDVGKQAHMLSALVELECRTYSRKKITKASTVLIDDDEYNVEEAMRNGVRGVVLKPKQPDELYPGLLELAASP